MSLPRVFGWAADNSGCGYYRIELPLREYARQGGVASWSDVMPDQEREEADVIIGQRVCLPGATNLWQYLCAKGRATMVLELDDDLWSIDPSNRGAYLTYRPELLDNLRRNITVADVVTVTTEPLADVVRPYNSNVVIVPNRIPTWLLEHERPVREDLTIGWAGSATHGMDWEDTAPQVARFLTRNTDVRAHVIGAVFKSMRGWPFERVRSTGWSASVEEYYRLLDFDVALAPLRAHAFNRSKSAVKALEYSALGIPVVASAVGPYETFVQHGVTGLLVRRDHEWAAHLRALAVDDDARREMGRRARDMAAEHTVEGNLDSWLSPWGVTVPETAAA